MFLSLRPIAFLFLSFDLVSITGAEPIQNYYNVTSLKHKLLEGYDRFVRPVYNINTVVNVTFGGTLYSLAGFNAKAETMTTLLWQRMFWKDELLQWNPVENEGVEYLRFDMVSVWRPDIFPFNDMASYQPDMYKNSIPIFVR